MNNLKNKIALITGASRNLGRAIAIDLAQQGAKIAVHYHTNKKEAEQTLEEVKKHSQGVIVKADVTKEIDIVSMYRYIEKNLGKVDILVNLVGNFIYEPITTTSFDKFQDVIESNLYATFLCSKQALPHMQKRKWGRIINFGCVGAESLTIREKTTPYYIAKTGVIMLTKVLAYEYAKYDITVNSISPGILKTSIAKPLPHEASAKWGPTPSGKFAEFADIINAINFLLKKESNYINGANLEVSGGWRVGFSG